MADLSTLDIIKNRVTVLKPLYNRMDKTRDLAYGNNFKLQDFEGKDLDKVVNVTTNWPGVFANAIINDLVSATWQTVIESEGKLSDKQKHEIENFIDDNLAQTDEQLIMRGYAKLFSWLSNHVCIRSLIGARWVSQFVDGKYVLDCLPVDMRWTPYEHGNDGLNWVANKTFRSPAKINIEYPGANAQGTTDIEVTDYWDGGKNEVWIADKLFRTQKNPFGDVPYVIVIPSSGFMLKDKGSIEHDAEDLFFLNRDLYDERSRSMSIEQTLGMDCLFPPYEQEAAEAGAGDKPPRTGEVTKVAKGELHQLLQRGDLTQAFRGGRADIQRDLQMGGVNDIDLGNVSQTVSAVWITEQSEIRNKLIMPRLEALAVFRQQLARKMISQYRTISDKKKTPSEITIGVPGRKRKYSVKQLGDPDTYTITNELMSQSKKQEIVNLAMFSAAREDLPLKTRLTDILKADDPDGIIRELGLEEAKRADPAIGLFEMAIRYAEEAEDLEGDDAEAKKVQSMMLTERGCSIIRQRAMQPEMDQEEQTTPAAGQGGPGVDSLVPLLGGGTPGARGPETMEE